jgi:hypothetical protein
MAGWYRRAGSGAMGPSSRDAYFVRDAGAGCFGLTVTGGDDLAFAPESSVTTSVTRYTPDTS